MPHAPQVQLPSGLMCTPQHYLTYQHTLASVSELASRIEFDEDTLVFVTEDETGLYVQIGLIGRENYDRGAAVRQRKLVYGRKWRIDADTPSSEIVQTIFLAIKKAREHEVRELLTVIDDISGATSAPLSCHQDLPMLAQSHDWLRNFNERQPHGAPRSQIHALLSKLRFAQRTLDIQALNFFAGQAWVSIKLGDKPSSRQLEGDLKEFDDIELCVRFDPKQAHHLVHEIQDALIRVSDRHVEETFRFDRFARFSRDINPLAVARLSVASRPYARDSQNLPFYAAFQQSNYGVDAGRAPHIGSGILAQRHRSRIQAEHGLLGHMPRGLEMEPRTEASQRLHLVEKTQHI